MSRGYGKWQRMILETLEHYPAFVLCDLAHYQTDSPTGKALNRAIHTLADKVCWEKRRLRLSDGRKTRYSGENGKIHYRTESLTVLSRRGYKVDFNAVAKLHRALRGDMKLTLTPLVEADGYGAKRVYGRPIPPAEHQMLNDASWTDRLATLVKVENE